MKTKAIQLTIVLMMFAATMFAQKVSKNEVWTSMTLKGTDKVELRMVIPDDEVVTLNVYNNYHQKVFTKRIKNKSNLLISYNIAPFPAGTYTYEIKNGKNIVSSTQIVKASGQALIYKPVEGIAEVAK